MRFVFTVVLFIFISCVVTTITSFNEIPLDILANPFKVNPIQDIELESSVDYNPSIVQRKSVSGRGEGKGEYGATEESSQTRSERSDLTNGNQQQYLTTNETTFSQAVSLNIKSGNIYH